MTPGQIGWFVAVAAIGIAIWYFKVHRNGRHNKSETRRHCACVRS